jgi:restriction endonuclease S subunit
MKLNAIADVNSGVYSNTITNGDVYYFQARDFDENRQLVNNLTPTLNFSENLKKHFLQIGDILIVAKGASFLSAVYDGTYAPAVASTVFLVIKIRAKKEVLPAFISWYLNLPSTQSELMNEAKGTSVHSINKSVLQNLEIPLLTKAKQEKLLQIIELRNHERQIEKRIEILKEKKMSQLITNAINN